ncbi:MAG: hypothetical protein IKM49_03950, partial [Ruminococcus sp.]|nr:hypothetical protein [Ruminococcus sp.]
MIKLKQSRWLSVVMALILSLTMIIQPTLAYIIARTQPSVNSFVPLPTIEGGMVISKTVEHPYGG